MANEQISVADIFRRAQELKRERSSASYKDLKELLLKEFAGKPFPSLHNLTIPEQDARAPEEDWSAGLPIVRRGIQFQDWKEVVDGILLSLERQKTMSASAGLRATEISGTTAQLGLKNRPGKLWASGCRKS